MEKLRYNRAFKKCLIAILCGILLFGSMVAYFAVFKIQYDRLVSNMKLLEATVVDIDLDVHFKGPDEQKITVEYVVDGVVYQRELETDIPFSFAAGTGAHYSIGDKVPIFYDPEQPRVIASPRSQSVGLFWLVFALFFLALVLFALGWMIKSRRRFLVTQAEYEKEGEEIKRSKQKEKERKKRLRLERKKQHPRARKAGRILLIILGILLGAFALYLLLGLLLLSARG